MDFTIKNGWILTLFWIFISYFPVIFGGKSGKRLFNTSWMSKKGWIYSTLIFLFSIILLVIPVFKSITDNRFLLITGGSLLAIGSIGVFISYHNYFTTPFNNLITKGLYKISRNPIYVFVSFASAGIAILCSSYVMGIALLLNLVFQHPVILEEEKYCTETYGKIYRDYKKRTRRYL